MRRMKRVLIVCLVLGIVGPAAVAEEPYYKGLVRLEVDLYTGDGVRLQEGCYRVEVRPDRGHYTLAFLSDDQVKAVVNGYKPDDGKLPATALFMGTEYLRSSEEPELTMEERRHSKTGQPQYQEENREWKAELRVLKSDDNTKVFFLFQEKQANGKWRRVLFKLRLKPAS